MTATDRYEGFAGFVHARAPSLFRTAYALAGDARMAEDLLQTALARTAQRWPQLRDGQPEAYARRILVSESTSRWRRRRGEAEVPIDQQPERRSGEGVEEPSVPSVDAAALADRSVQQSEQMRRRTLTAGPPLAAALALLLLTAFLLVATTHRATPAGPPPSRASLPSTIYDAPPWLDGVSAHPVGGPAALLYDGLPMRDSAGRATSGIPVAVGATREVARAVRSIAATADLVWAPSPDGRYVAIAQGMGPPRAVALSVTVVDLVTGAERTFRYLPNKRGSVDGLLWIPRTQALVADFSVLTSGHANGWASTVVKMRLDTRTGSWAPWMSTGHLPMALSPDGRRAVQFSETSGLQIVAVPDSSAVPIHVDLRGTHGVQSAAFSPDGSRVAILVQGLARGESAETASSPSVLRSFDLVVVDSRTGNERTRQRIGPVVSATLLGWGRRGLLVGTEHRVGRVTIERVTPGDSTRTRVLVRTTPGVDVDRVAVPTAFVDAPVRRAQRTNYSAIDPAAVTRWAKRGGVLLLIVLLFVVTFALRRRRAIAPFRVPPGG